MRFLCGTFYCAENWWSKRIGMGEARRGEALKTRLNAGRTPDLYFIRDQHGTEIDLVVEDGRSLHLFEIKSSTSFSTDFTRNLDAVRRAIPEVASATVVYGGDSAVAVRAIEFVPFRDHAARMRQLGLA